MHRFDPDGPGVLSWLTPELPRFLRCQKAMVTTFRQSGDRIAIGSFHGVALRDVSQCTFEGWLARQPAVGWTSYNPIRPEPQQRNRVWDYAALERHLGRSRAAYPIYQLYGKLGIAHDEQVRVLVCDGASLLAYVGAYQPDGFTIPQKTAFGAILQALKRRLTLERTVAQGARQAAALEVALKAIGRPAFVVSAPGTIHETNASARELLEHHNLDVRHALADALARRPSRYLFEVIPLRLGASTASYLAVLRDNATEVRDATCAAAASARWRLTPRRREVLGMVVRGLANATIAAELGVSERAVEGHVSAIFDRAGVENRAALVAFVMRSGT
jgi:DNA-binding CsgD family transcriptional regulator